MNFCTLFDTNYLSRGLALHESLCRTLDDFRLYVFAFDPRCAEVLASLELPKVTVIPRDALEDETLLAVQPERSAAEYIWTSTSSAILHVLETYPVDHCTYLDADLYFYASPKVLLRELGGDSVLITGHRFSPRYEWLEIYGKYCVQFMTFRNDRDGLAALRWWRDACLDWCFARLEDGKFGDQKYLDDWPSRFAGVHELEHPGGGVAPWNLERFRFSDAGRRLRAREVATGRDVDVVFFQFHHQKLRPGGRADLGVYRFPEGVERRIYGPYLRRLMEIGDRLKERFPDLDPHGIRPPESGVRAALRSLHRRLTGTYHVHPIADLSAPE